ncbi:MAG: 23S rRNA (guanosine(2251)-2'-O)-methyltransferase RlmB [Candidatus Omnitrophica bacterium]|nr:23S rRNA (guanosine(2251)-2'-O)-methyltransferase RlmB [Candidatus Omnitrophota bacterium]
MKLYGKNPVLERLKTNPKSIKYIFIEQGHIESGYIHMKGKQWGIPVSVVPYTKIQKLARNLNTQGIVADVEDFPYLDINDLLQTAHQKRWTVLFLDRLTDPQNLGGIMRTCGSLGDFAIVLPTTESVGITESVLRVACGGDNYVPVARVANLGHAIEKAKNYGFWIMGTAVKEAKSIFEVSMQFPLGLVLGSEDKGVREIIRKKLDQEVMIPMKAVRMSLNVAHATSILCYEIIRQKNK